MSIEVTPIIKTDVRKMLKGGILSAGSGDQVTHRTTVHVMGPQLLGFIHCAIQLHWYNHGYITYNHIIALTKTDDLNDIRIQYIAQIIAAHTISSGSLFVN